MYTTELIITVASLLFAACFFVFKTFANRKHNIKWLGAVGFIVSIAAVWVGSYNFMDWGAATMWVWGIGMVLSTFLSYGFGNYYKST